MWQLAEAKNKFSEVFTRAMTEGPQRVRRRGQTVVVLSEAEYDRLAARDDLTIADFILNGPSLEGLEFERDKSPGREVDLE
jgi:antitoxin Phd